VVCTSSGRSLVEGLDLGAPVSAAPRVPATAWEQLVLPAVATRLRAAAVYSHRECGALWGPRLVLHVPEDPEIRWRREPTSDRRELARRRYSRLMMDRSLRRSTVVASTGATVRDLEHNHGLDPMCATVVPLGVDLELFQPQAGAPTSPAYFFHLASSDDRDRTDLVVRAFDRYRADRPDGARLVIGGRLGDRKAVLEELIAGSGARRSVTLLGEVDDEALAQQYAGALATVHASPDEGFGLQPLEAMASGSLLICTPAEAVEEVTEGGVVLWSEPTVDAMADALRRAEDAPDLGAKARLANRRLAEHFSWERTADAVHQLLSRT